MPYIKDNDRMKYDGRIAGTNPLTCGDLNYCISRLCHLYICDNGLSYRTLNEVIGVLECAKMELYRTVASLYEDKKRMENGSVSDLDDNSREKMT